MKENKRKFLRIKDSVDLQYRIISGGLKTDSYCVDISEEGVRLPVFHKLEPGTQLELTVHLPQGPDPVVLTGQVMWIKPQVQGQYRFIAGIQFVKTESPKRNKIIAHILRNISEDKEI